ncbi:hypothetical protein [Flavobacterium sp.]|uniref:hypothetical protein n=1 Tax=Flavobacterium sp. TaxID=239 RepID=UPI002629D5C4|nr:hypothetical protein [Flavobacterium sp.]
MENKYKLIEGDFSVNDAREVVSSLLEYKIQYHNRLSFSHEIKKGSPDEHSINRKEELMQEKERFLQQLASLGNDATISIKAEIIVS